MTFRRPESARLAADRAALFVAFAVAMFLSGSQPAVQAQTVDPSCVPQRMVYTETSGGHVAGQPLPPIGEPLENGVLGPFNPNESEYHCYVSGGLAWAPNCATNKCQCPSANANFSAPCNDPATAQELGSSPPAGGASAVGQCPSTHPSCGVASGQFAATCPDGKVVEWSTSGVVCGNTLESGERCYACVDAKDGEKEGGGDGDGVGGDPPPMCPVGCAADADCGEGVVCAPDQKDPTKPGCFLHNNVCVKKCQVPRCVNNRCTMAAPPNDPVTGPYLACDVEGGCPAPRCGDGIVQAGPPAGGGGGGDVGGGDDGGGDLPNGCPEAFPLCADFPGQNQALECPAGQRFVLETAAMSGWQCGEEGDGACYKCVPEDTTILGCNALYPLCAPANSQTCPAGQEPEGVNISCTKGGAAGTCYKCVPYGQAGGATCNVTGTSCAQVPDARACREPRCVDVNGRDIQGTSCTCPTQQNALDCQNGYRPLGNGPISPTPNNCVGGWYVQAANSTCNCVMAALPGAKTSTTNVASLINGSSLLATSIINNCSVSCSPQFVENNCGPGDACFALMGWNTVQQQCAPADCAGREEECGMMPRVRIQGQPPSEWGVCAGTEVPDEDGGDEGDPDPVPVPAGGEECDDGNNEANDGCGPACKKEVCGDGALQQKGADGKPNTADDEECDDGNLNLGDGCTNRCKAETCGNGEIEYGEECDNGPRNSDTAPGACRTNCMLPKCNDGVIDTPLGEQCDCGEEGANFDWQANKDDAMSPYCDVEVDGKPAICHMGMCKAYYCGDGFTFNAGHDRESGTADDEMCDAGPFNTDAPVGDGTCNNNAQCPGSVCVNGKCAGEINCSENSECHGGKCIGGRCKPGGCEDATDCDAGDTCYQGQCRTGGNGYGYNTGSCDENSDCPSGNCYPNGFCMEEISVVPQPTCRMDCKPIRCGDGIVDAGAGETCDEGAAMFRCNGTPQPACDCAIPSWGSHTRPMGEPFNYTCCPEGQYCSVWPTATCPQDCGVGGGPGVPVCGNHVLDAGEECDTSVAGYTPAMNPEDQQVLYVYRPVRDGTTTAYLGDDGNWTTVPSTIESHKKYTTIDHEPAEISPDDAYIITVGDGSARTYFHLWDIPLTNATVFSQVKIRAGVDFTGVGEEWDVIELPFVVAPSVGFLTAVHLNAAALEIVADENTHTLTFRLYNSVTGDPLTLPLTMASPVPLTGLKKIAVDAVEVLAIGTSEDASYACAACKIAPRCGNTLVETGEECDDGNVMSDDGCTDRCLNEICAVP